MGITTRFKKSSIVLAFALVGAACASGSDTEDSGAAETVSETTTTAEDAAETTVTTAVQTAEGDAEAEEAEAEQSGEWYEGTKSFDSPPAFVADAELMEEQFTDLDAGVYRNRNLGTEVSFEVGDGWATRPNNPPIIVLSSLSNDGPGDMDVVFLRIEGLSDPSQPGADPDEQEGAGTDIQLWLAEVIPGIVVGQSINGSLGGHDATIFNVELSDDVECAEEFFCIAFATNRFVESLSFERNFRYRVYWVEQGEESPIAVVVGSKSSDEGWFAKADEVLETVAFGPVQPNPIGPGDVLAQGFSAEAESTTVELPIAGGIRFDVAEEQFIRQGPGAAFILGEGPYESDIIAATADLDQNPITTAEELAAALEANERIELTFVSEAQVGGLEANVYELTSAGQPDFNNPDLRTEGEGWFSPPEAQIWVMDTPEGPLMITAEVFENSDIFFPIAMDLANKVVDSLEFIG